jgi:hypothetical protein
MNRDNNILDAIKVVHPYYDRFHLDFDQHPGTHINGVEEVQEMQQLNAPSHGGAVKSGRGGKGIGEFFVRDSIESHPGDLTDPVGKKLPRVVNGKVEIEQDAKKTPRGWNEFIDWIDNTFGTSLGDSFKVGDNQTDEVDAEWDPTKYPVFIPYRVSTDPEEMDRIMKDLRIALDQFVHVKEMTEDEWKQNEFYDQFRRMILVAVFHVMKEQMNMKSEASDVVQHEFRIRMEQKKVLNEEFKKKLEIFLAKEGLKDTASKVEKVTAVLQAFLTGIAVVVNPSIAALALVGAGVNVLLMIDKVCDDYVKKEIAKLLGGDDQEEVLNWFDRITMITAMIQFSATMSVAMSTAGAGAFMGLSAIAQGGATLFSGISDHEMRHALADHETVVNDKNMHSKGTDDIVQKATESFEELQNLMKEILQVLKNTQQEYQSMSRAAG